MNPSLAPPATTRRPRLSRRLYLAGMSQPTYLPTEATPALRRQVVVNAKAAAEAAGAVELPEVEAAYERYINGELSLEEAGEQALQIIKDTIARSNAHKQARPAPDPNRELAGQ